MPRPGVLLCAWTRPSRTSQWAPYLQLPVSFPGWWPQVATADTPGAPDSDSASSDRVGGGRTQPWGQTHLLQPALPVRLSQSWAPWADGDAAQPWSERLGPMMAPAGPTEDPRGAGRAWLGRPCGDRAVWRVGGGPVPALLT